MTVRKNKPLSGIKEIDWHFIEITNVIEHVFEKIHLKKVIKDPDDRRKRLYGYLSDDHTEVYVTHAPPKQPAAKTLLHESLHAICPYVKEARIKTLEKHLWKRFTDNQKRHLRRYVPKHMTRKEP
mgnify:CR=1 FL=1